tara:strand:- start:189 stop:824 length:636 start_codon:yes stop_codon:yes gene_type:complete
MTKLIYLFTILLFLAFPKAQYDGVSIGIQSASQNVFHSATFYKGNLFSGLDAVRMGLDIEESSASGGLSINILMPRFGYRKIFKDSGKLTSYNQIETYLLLPLLTTSGELVIDSDTEKDLKDALSLMGFKVSHSIQYNFNKQLALVADIGFNMIFWDLTMDLNEDSPASPNSNDIEGNDYYYENQLVETATSELSLHLGYTYSKLSLLFSF